MKRAAATLVLAAAFGLSACGSSTVDSSEVDKEQTSTSSSESTETTTTEPTSSTNEAAPAPEREPQEGDQPAQEITAIPTQSHVNTPEEDAYLAALSDKGVNVQGVEDQLTATAFSVCENTTITRDAVAGQLIEQQRTELDADAVAQLIDSTAREHLC